MTELIPAMDIIGGECVRLTKGDYTQKKVYSRDPVAVAKGLAAKGFKRLHMVDLEGAKSSHVINLDVLRNVSAAVDIKIDFGGGIKARHDMDAVFDSGAAMVTVGSISCTAPETLESWIDRYGTDRIILGADVKNKRIAINGWLDETKYDIFEFIEHYKSKGISNVLCTDISRDGALNGPSVSLYKEIMERFPDLHLMASGGISSADDILTLASNGIPAVVFGKAYYEGLIDLDKLEHLI